MPEIDQMWREWGDKIPYIRWPHNWKVKAIPPFSGAVIRYLITKDENVPPVSVYLDCYNALAYMNGPYWEVYPYNDDIIRHPMEDTKGMLNSIRIALRQRKRDHAQLHSD